MEVVTTTEHHQSPSHHMTPLRTILSKLSDDFDMKYDLLNEIGRGGFSTVYQCQNRITKEIYAVKAIDLRPLRLRENFDPKRLRREVDIMKGLHHPNIIQFQDVYENENHLLVVMEYAPGKELFDVILEKRKFSEDEAKPIFYQIASALAYMHSNGIIHRDIKPENVLVLNNPDPKTGIPVIKILDFGLSKQTGGGSLAKTFVGTPCYLAPEVEQTSLQNGTSYDTPADCWSLGAVLYVMLVAHFPEFDRNVGKVGRVVLRLPPHLWRDISSEAKTLVQGLLCYESDVRMTAADAMRHEWIGHFKEPVLQSANYLSHPPAKATKGTPKTNRNVYDLITTSPENQRILFDVPPINIPHHVHSTPPHINYSNSHLQSTPKNMVSMYHQNAELVTNENQTDVYLRIAPLISLQSEALQCFRNAENIYAHRPEVMSHIRSASVRCKQQLQDSIRMLRKIEQTSIAALDIIPDMEMALEAGEPQLIASLLGTIKTWVSDLVTLVSTTQKSNEETIENLHQAVNVSDQLQLTARNLRAAHAPLLVDSAMIVNEIRRVVSDLQERGSHQGLTDQDILELFSNLFGQENWRERGIIYTPSPSASTQGKRHQTASSPKSSDVDETIIGTGSPGYVKATENNGNQLVETKRHDDVISAINVLREVDDILSQLSIFWSNTDVILDALSKKGQHIETFVSYTKNPNLVNRFRERMMEYRRFWERVHSMCNAYLMGMQDDSSSSMNRISTPPEEVFSSPQSSFT